MTVWVLIAAITWGFIGYQIGVRIERNRYNIVFPEKYKYYWSCPDCPFEIRAIDRLTADEVSVDHVRKLHGS